MSRRSIVISDEMWAAVVKAAARETARTGEIISVSEWIRRAIQKDLSKEAS